MIESTLARGYGTLAGFGFIGAALFAIPSAMLLEPPPPGGAFLLTLAALATGFICLALPWERIDPRWLHVAGVVATVEAAAAVVLFGRSFVVIYFLVAFAVAYVAPYTRIVAGHLGLIALALLGPIVYGPEGARATLQEALIVFPNLVLATGLFAYLRMRMVADRASHRRFAEQTLALASRIAGHPVSEFDTRSARADALAWHRRFRMPARIAAAIAAVCVVPLLAAGAAAAGAKLPPFAVGAFDRIGLEFPDQGTGPSGTRRIASVGTPAVEVSAGKKGNQGTAQPGGARPQRAQDRKRAQRPNGAGPQPAPAPSGGTARSADPPSAVSAAPTGQAPGPPAPPPQPGPVGKILDDTAAAISALLDEGKPTKQIAPLKIKSP